MDNKIIEAFDEVMQQYYENKISERSLICRIKNNDDYMTIVAQMTAFLDEYNITDFVERIYYVAKKLDSVVKCKYCDNKATWNKKGIRGGYKEICSSKGCRSKQNSDSHVGKTIISEKRNSEFIKWQASVTEVNDEIIKKHITFDKFINLITNPILLNYLNNRFNDSASLEETLKRIRIGIEEKPKCALPGCNNPVTFIGRKRAMFTKFCCPAHSAQSEETRNKCKQTNLKHWGSEGVYDSSIYQQKLLDEYGVRYHTERPEVNEKIISKRNTNGKNGTSEEEKELYRILRDELGYTFYTQHHTDEYPFSCDIYFPDWNLYLEYNGCQYHMGRPFMNTEEDKALLEELKEKNRLRCLETGKKKSQYASMIKVWTKCDVKKRNWALEHNLNFLEIYHYKDADDVKRQIRDYLITRGIIIK